jgi:cytochrome c
MTKLNMAAFICWVFFTSPALGQTPAVAPTPVDPGARAFARCSTCHTLKAGERNLVGPNLASFWGKRAGTNSPGFRYSAAFRTTTLVWNEQTLDQFLRSPSRTIPGTSMMSPGITAPQTRAALIEFLKREAK